MGMTRDEPSTTPLVGEPLGADTHDEPDDVVDESADMPSEGEMEVEDDNASWSVSDVSDSDDGSYEVYDFDGLLRGGPVGPPPHDPEHETLEEWRERCALARQQRRVQRRERKRAYFGELKLAGLMQV